MAAVIGHEDIRRELRVLAGSAEPPHALMFVGPEGTGRRLLALEYGQLLNCERAPWNAPAGASLFGDELPPTTAESVPCGSCRNCRLISEGAHPDVVMLGPGDTLCKPRSGESAHPRHPDSRDVRICQVRGLIELVSRYPFEAKHRVIVIDPADRIGREASNTILKTLEEPPGHTVFALLTAAPEAVLETIRSRCRQIEVRPVPRDQIQRGLREMEYAPEIAARAAAESRGHPGRALEFAEHPDRMDDRDRRLERCARIAAGRVPERFKYAEELAERFRRDKSSAWPDLEAWEGFWEERLHTLARHDGDEEARRDAVRALRAVARAREDLLANVIARAAFELMLLSFPRIEAAAVEDGAA
ncbi:MAG: ATP-binding protein [Gemmatimonadales bacterium]